MSNLKIKIAFEDDIRIFKTTPNSTELLSKIISFVKETHKIDSFRLVYKDEEEDEITVVDDGDLKEALNNNNSNKTVKLYVKKINKELLESDSTSDETSPDEEEIELEYFGTKGWGVMFGGFHTPRHHGRHHRGHHRGHKHHRHGRHHHHKHHHRHHHGHHGHHAHHGHKFGKRGGMHKHCGFFKKFEKCQKDSDLRVDIVDENVSLGKNSFVSGGKYLIKTWKLKNVGNKVIPSNCSIEYFGRRFNLMIDGSKFELKNKEIDINEEFEVSISVKSPIENGKYKSKWRLITPDEKKFGQPLFVSFIVKDNNNNNKILKKQEKLRCKKEKLLEKLHLLEEKSNELKNNNDDKDDVKEEIEGNETQNNIDNINLNQNDIIIDEIIVEDDEDTFIYGVQLQQLQNMGFDDENKLKNLLTSNNGSIEDVLNNIF